MTQRMEITTKRIEAGRYEVTREDGEVFHVCKASRKRWDIVREANWETTNALSFHGAKFLIKIDVLA